MTTSAERQRAAWRDLYLKSEGLYLKKNDKGKLLLFRVKMTNSMSPFQIKKIIRENPKKKIVVFADREDPFRGIYVSGKDIDDLINVWGLEYYKRV